jgi:hypothetical protein
VNDDELVEYRIELSATFDVDISSSVLGPSGLSRVGIEELVERDWMWICADKNVLQESRWELMSFAESRSSGLDPLPRSGRQSGTRHSAPRSPVVERTTMRDQSAESTREWVVLVTDGTVIEYPPEVYHSRERALLEAERWAWLLSGEGALDIERPFEGRWQVRDRDVRLVEVERHGGLVGLPWVGTYWTRSGPPDPEALLLDGEADARAWVRQPPSPGLDAPQTFDTPWLTVAIYVIRGEEEYAVAHLAKVVD